MSRLTHVYLDVICIIVLGFILFRMKRSLYLSTSNQRFSSVVENVSLLLGLDAVAVLASGYVYPLSLITNATFLTWVGVTGFSWLHYTETAIGRPEPPRALRILKVLPAAAIAILCYASIWTGWVFTVDPTTILYHRGPFHFVQMILSAGYLVAAVAITLQDLARCTSPQQRTALRSLLSLFIFPAVGAALDALVYGIPFTWTLCSVGIVKVFVDFQDYSISTDGLTGLNNRRHFEGRAQTMVEDATAENRVFLLLMDIDDFKDINDTYGHRTGDATLVLVARVLKRIVGDSRLLIARYGGDEFAVVGVMPDLEEAEKLKGQIEDALAGERVATPELSFPITLSIGISEAGLDGTGSVDSLVIDADKELYAEKQRRRVGR